MRILFAGKQHYDPGGIPASTDQLAHRLGLGGHDVAVFAHAAFDGPALPENERRSVRREQGRGYDAWSVDLLPPGAGLGVICRSFRPDVVVVNAGGHWWHDWTRALVDSAPTDVPLVLYIRDPEALDLLDDLAPRVDLVLANAVHHADRAAARGVSAEVVPSVVEPERYLVEPTGEAVVFINPVASKGVETAFALAERRPDVPFHFRESWHLPVRAAESVAARAAELGNVEFLRTTTVPTDPYRRARLLLAPYEDLGRPRVVAEAQISGIPVLARDDPPLREAVGPGGILVPAEAPLEAWLEGLAQLWDDPQVHARCSEAARVHSRRREIDADDVARRFGMALASVVDARGTRSRRRVVDDTLPLASVIVPVRNVADTIDDQLAALSHQSYAGRWELVVADNGCTDATLERVDAWRARLPSVTVVDASRRRGVAHARNVGLRAANGEVLLICDGDDIVAPDWLQYMVGALEDHPIVTGFIDLVTMNRPKQYEWTGDATMRAVPTGYGFLPYAPGGNIGMWCDVFDALVAFDERLRRAEDIDFGWRAGYLGIPIHFEPRAVLHRRLRSTPRAEFWAAVRGGIAEPGLYRRHRDRGMPRAELQECVQQYRWLLQTVPDVIGGRHDPYQWAHHAGKRVGRVIGSARNGVTYL